MHNPFKTPAYKDYSPTASTPHIKILLFLLSVVIAYMLTKDFHHLLSVHSKSLANGANISIFHYIYLKVAPLEIAYFRVSSSIAMLALTFLAVRNRHLFQKYYFSIIAYGATQLIYQTLAVTGVIGILSHVAGTSSLNMDFWFAPTMASNTTQLLLTFLVIMAPPLIYLAICIITKSKIKTTKYQCPSPSHISN